MAVDLKSLKNHPGRNPEYDRLMSTRRGFMAENRARASMGVPLLTIPPQPNKYVPHIGAKQRARGQCECAAKGIPDGYLCGKPSCARTKKAEAAMAVLMGTLNAKGAK